LIISELKMSEKYLLNGKKMLSAMKKNLNAILKSEK
jgi:hypothetical protein